VDRSQLDTYYGYVGVALAGRRATFRSDLDAFYSMLQARLDISKAARGRIALLNAPDFTPFGYISPDENTVSRIVADLLDADGAHGQGGRFLRKFLALLKVDTRRLPNRYVVVTQSPLFASRFLGFLDILVDFGDFGVGIENKPWAGEQVNQIERYCAALESRYSDKFCLVYLSGTGRDPTSISGERLMSLKSKNKLITVRYGAIQHWARDCASVCEADKVRWFLRDFERYLADNFAGDGGDDESD
jgi:hypothetical protein